METDLLFLVEHHIVKMDIIRYYLLSKSTALKPKIKFSKYKGSTYFWLQF